LRLVHLPLLACLLGLMPVADVAAQAESPVGNGAAVFPVDNGHVLTGVDAVDAQVLLLNWLDMDGDARAFRAAANAEFRSAIRQLGVSVQGQVSHFLFCELKVAGVGAGGVVYSWAVGYYEFVVGGAHRLEWTTGGIVKVGRRNFSASAAIDECVEGFGREWTRWNSPGF